MPRKGNHTHVSTNWFKIRFARPQWTLKLTNTSMAAIFSSRCRRQRLTHRKHYRPLHYHRTSMSSNLIVLTGCMKTMEILPSGRENPTRVNETWSKIYFAQVCHHQSPARRCKAQRT